jgi:hypothetical protein
VIFSRRYFNGQIQSGCASSIVLNQEGWILTTAHVAKEIALADQHKPELQDFYQKQNAIQNDPHLNDKAKRKQIGHLAKNQKWITNQATLWGGPGMTPSVCHIDEVADIAILKLENFNPAFVSEYPIFKNPAEPMLPGTSLCRLGFPFHQIEATFDAATGTFKLAPNAVPVPRFPNDGIHTRIAIAVTPDGSRQAKFLETSTPGLMGQSGGPIFDRFGHIWAMQSRTQSLSLGFAPAVIGPGGTKTVEHQFMHIGWGSHVEEIIRMLRQFGVQFRLSS